MGNRLKDRFYAIVIAGIDLIILYGSYLSAFYIIFGYHVPARNWDSFLKLAPWMGIAAIVIFSFFDLYLSGRRREYHHFVYSIVLSVGLLVIVMIAVSFWTRGFAMPRSVILLGTLFEAFLMLVVRTIIWYIQLKVNGAKRVLIVGKSMENGLKIADKFLEHSKGWFEISGFLMIDNNKRSLFDYMDKIDVVLITPELSGEEKAEILSYSSRYMKEVMIVPELYELFLMGAETQQVDDMLVLSIKPPSLSAGELFTKRLIDVVVSLVIIIITSPILLLLFIIIPLTSKGGPLYRQERIGKNGTTYILYKFRSMILNAERKSGPVLAMEEDPRVTLVGKFLRATRLDELPQLFNVLKGDMSLVGPRPERPFFTKQFTEELPNYMYRVAVKPGITGLAQVMAKYSTDAEEKLRYDLMYIRNYTILLDVKILLQTLIVSVRGIQARGLTEKNIDRERLLRKLMNDTETA